METTIMALISLVGTAVGTFGGILTANRLTNYRLEQLEIKVDKHNSVIERTTKVEGRMDVTDERIRVANHRIDDVEEWQKEHTNFKEA